MQFKINLLLTISVITVAAVVATVIAQRQWRAVAQSPSTAGKATAGSPHRHADGGSHSHADDDSHAHEDGQTHGHSHAHEDDQSHSRQHEGHDDASAIQLSAAAWKNVGLRTGTVETSTFVRTVAVPAIVVERPGRSQVEITAPLTGIVTRVYPIEGQAIQPGEALFTLRLTHEDLVTAQTTFLHSAHELDVVQAEIKRLKSAGEGVVAGRRVIEQQYREEQTRASIHAQRQSLLWHGLTDEQVDEIVETRELLQTLTVVAPQFAVDTDHHEVKHVYHVQKISVRRGQHVTAGTELGVLADHSLLYVQGQAFEDDAPRLMQAAREAWTMEVSPVRGRGDRGQAESLQVFYIADHVDPLSRALNFYLVLENQLDRNEQRGEHRFIDWKYRPGQRMEVNLPTGEPWKNQIVLPVEAIVEEGAEAFVFQQNGDHFDRIAVHVLYRDKNVTVIENDKRLVGTTIAMSGAYQMQLALKKRAGGGSGGDAHGHPH